MFVFLAFSSFSSWVASFSLNFTQVVSHNAHISSHTTPLISQVTQLISHNSSHSTHLTQLNSLKSCFRVAFGGAASCSLTELHPSSFTQLISQLTQLISHYSTHLTTHTTHLTYFRSVTNLTDWSNLTKLTNVSSSSNLTKLANLTQLTHLTNTSVTWCPVAFIMCRKPGRVVPRQNQMRSLRCIAASWCCE